MRRTMWIGSIILCAASTAALADGGYYVGARGGPTWTSVDGGKLTTELRSRGHAVTATVDDEDYAGNVYLGKTFARGFSLELGYLDLGDYAVSVTGSTTLGAAQLARDVVDLQAKTGSAVSFVGRFSVPVIGERLFFTPRIGGFYWNSRTEVLGGGGTTTIDDDGLGVVAGLGLDFAVTRAVHLGGGWELWRPDEQGATSLLFGQVEVHFGP